VRLCFIGAVAVCPIWPKTAGRVDFAIQPGFTARTHLTGLA